MGEIAGDALQSNLRFVPKSEYERVYSAKISKPELAGLLANLSRINALYMVASAGSGHLGTSFSSMEIFTWFRLFRSNQQASIGKESVFFSSKGHDAPALYATLFAADVLEEGDLHRFRRYGGLPGHPDISTAGVVTNTGSLGMGISKAKGVVRAARLRGVDVDVAVLCGDGELQEGQIWESLLSAKDFPEITVIVDQNGLQSDDFVDSVSSLGNLVRKFEAFGCRVARCDGNDSQSLQQAMRTLDREVKAPKVLIAETKKGCGVTFMEASRQMFVDGRYPFHSGALSAEDYRRALSELISKVNAVLVNYDLDLLSLRDAPSVVRQSLSTATNPVNLFENYSRYLVHLGQRSAKVVVFDADLRFDLGLDPFAQRFPERFFECGIAEQDMVSQAGTMANAGFIPVVHSFSAFLTARANEQIYNNATEGSRIIYVGGLSGILPGPPGHSHQSTRDVALMGSVPGMAVLTPATPEDLEEMLVWASESNEGSSFIRITSGLHEVPVGLRDASEPLEKGRGRLLKDGSEVLLIASGPFLNSLALRVAEALSVDGFSASVADMRWMNLVDKDWWSNVIDGKNRIVFLHDFEAAGSSIGPIIELALGAGMKERHIHSFGPHGVPVGGQNHEVLGHYGLELQQILHFIGMATIR